MSYAWSTQKIRNQIKKIATSGIVVHVRRKDIKKIKIPLPPLEIQEQIVEVLDAFRELVRELETELKLRKQQFEYYKEKLISDIDKSEFKKFGEFIGEIDSGGDIGKKHLNTGKDACVLCHEIGTTYKYCIEKCFSSVDGELIKSKKWCFPRDLLITNGALNAESIGSVCAYVNSNKCLIGTDLFIVRHNQNPKYLSYALSTWKTRKQIKKFATSGVATHIKKKDVQNLKIPLPPLEIQEKIVNQLEPLRALYEDLEKGLPKEIELAKKRYEYYKELLINGNQ
ncbi:putative type-1 restriction enzyme specificity protein MPN_089 [Candidatus Mycoplasma haematohominis]|uniref:Putative type-1 restriction enzyme specificity protein MPN_089 n=1 Tax=Candidatus Mycoplasma haematohominis TaxID=1494318 RepID=A0A478FQC8_9MOLU|nr:putative type-1 restriction enzyme specificity protein MPN_089 [Candidatus Mycoplasma haemohominis]